MEFKIGQFVTIKSTSGDKDIEGYIYGITDDGRYLVKLYDEFNTSFATSKDTIITRGIPKLVYDQFKQVSITKEMTFDSCHNLREYDGKCAKLHGHTYKIQITCKGQINPETGMVLDFGIVKKYMKEIVDEYDHAYLNNKMEFNTTAENMVCFIFDRLYVKILEETNKHVELVKVRLWETPTSFAEYNIEND